MGIIGEKHLSQIMLYMTSSVQIPTSTNYNILWIRIGNSESYRYRSQEIGAGISKNVCTSDS